MQFLTSHVSRLAGLMLLSAHAGAATIYVGPNGNDSLATSSQAAPFKTLAKAAGVVNPGDTVTILPGVYGPFALTRSGTAPTAPNLVGGAGGAAITWKPLTPDSVQIVGDDSGGPAIRVQASYQILDNLIVRGNTEGVTLAQAQAYYAANPAGDKFNGSGILLDNTGAATPVHGLWVRNSVIRNFGCNGVEVLGSDYSAIERNQVYDNAAYSTRNCSGITLAVAPRAGDPASTDNIYHSVIIGNKVWNNRVQVTQSTLTRKYAGGNGIVVGPVAAANKGRTAVYTNVLANNGNSAIVLSDASRVEVGYNSTYKNGVAELTVLGTSDSNVKSNAFYAPEGGKSYVTNGNTLTDLNYNIVFNGKAVGDADISLDPRFLNPQLDVSKGDFHLAATSPGIDVAFGGNAGSTKLRADLPVLPTNSTWGFDGDGVVYRTFKGNGLDRGAYEYSVITLPLGWGDGNRVGIAVGVGGANDASGETYGTWTLVGRGAGLRTKADSFSSAFRPWTGDVVVTAKLVSATVRDEPDAVVGVSIRAGTSVTAPLTNAAHVSTLVSPRAGVLYVRRAQAGGATLRSTGDNSRTQDLWLRIARVGTAITSSVSSDGVTWEVVRREVLLLPAAVQVGMVFSNGRPGTNVAANWATFTNVSVSAP